MITMIALAWLFWIDKMNDFFTARIGDILLWRTEGKSILIKRPNRFQQINGNFHYSKTITTENWASTVIKSSMAKVFGHYKFLGYHKFVPILKLKLLALQKPSLLVQRYANFVGMLIPGM